MHKLDKALRAAKQALLAGEKELLPRFKKGNPGTWRYKKHSEIVTEADEASNRAIIRTLTMATPEHGILTEESPKLRGSKNSYWVVDPLDGTTNYTAHLPLWGISIALVEEGEVTVAAISLPTMKERYFAIKNRGAWVVSGTRKQKLNVSNKQKIKDALGLFCYGYMPEEKIRGIRHVPQLTQQSRSTRRLGAAVFEAVWVASGRAEYSVLHGIHDWDVAAGVLLIREAGGEVMTPQGKQWKLGDKDFLAVCPDIKKPLLKIFRHD
ncbi:MAG: inositol monophosphatase [Patescibacteria group bacterium]|nr:inositol monophosphatase [Patescibacteria group bacterium]